METIWEISSPIHGLSIPISSQSRRDHVPIVTRDVGHWPRVGIGTWYRTGKRNGAAGAGAGGLAKRPWWHFASGDRRVSSFSCWVISSTTLVVVCGPSIRGIPTACCCGWSKPTRGRNDTADGTDGDKYHNTIMHCHHRVTPWVDKDLACGNNKSRSCPYQHSAGSLRGGPPDKKRPNRNSRANNDRDCTRQCPRILSPPVHRRRHHCCCCG